MYLDSCQRYTPPLVIDQQNTFIKWDLTGADTWGLWVNVTRQEVQNADRAWISPSNLPNIQIPNSSLLPLAFYRTFRFWHLLWTLYPAGPCPETEKRESSSNLRSEKKRHSAEGSVDAEHLEDFFQFHTCHLRPTAASEDVCVSGLKDTLPHMENIQRQLMHPNDTNVPVL